MMENVQGRPLGLDGQTHFEIVPVYTLIVIPM
jgi:hypothetical protein